MASTPTPEEPIVLSREQRKVLRRVRRGKNVFFTGSAGTGKSALLREIIKSLGGVRSGKLVVTASTGIAAVKIDGTTLHSFAGVGLGRGSKEELYLKISTRAIYLRRWKDVKILVIDEISMIDGSFFDKLDYLTRKIRQNSRPFGGIQLIVTGDFFQLPPIPDAGKKAPIIFAFDAKSWNRCFGPPIILTKGFRQNDQKFIDMLNEIRLGRVSDRTVAKLKKLRRPVQYKDGIVPTELFPSRRYVEQANRARLECLPGRSHTYPAVDMVGFDELGNRIGWKEAERSLEQHPAQKEVTLQIGAQVMLIRNLAQNQFVNGSLGKVIGFKTIAAAQDIDLPIAEAYSIVRFTNGEKLLCVPTKFSIVNALGQPEVERDQIPLILAWAWSIHKSQGQTCERVKIDLRGIFQKGQSYAALSRATNMEEMQVLNFSREKVMVHPRVLEWRDEMMQE